MAHHPGTQHLLDLFEYKHLPPHLQIISQEMAEAATYMAENLGGGPELTTGLRKLLEAKDCFVRQAVIDERQAIAGAREAIGDARSAAAA
ncbi:hypothetical protein [Rhodococcoides fascians]|uniref:hypothetical protein n=1 Tax=Rhodococcoides fascians TaxID=1828 RepID=UPI00068BC3FF|nr:hypothetical protein [Rhodococcus fascians]